MLTGFLAPGSFFGNPLFSSQNRSSTSCTKPAHYYHYRSTPLSRIRGRKTRIERKASKSERAKRLTTTTTTTTTTTRAPTAPYSPLSKTDAATSARVEEIKSTYPFPSSSFDYDAELRKRPDLLNLDSCPALVLNADYQPLSYLPLSLWPWQEVMKAVCLDRVNIVEVYDIGVRSSRSIFPLPSVVSLKRYQSFETKRPAFTRFNVFLRDDFKCQYCNQKFNTQDLTFDHVNPRCRGGKTNWNNVVTACVDCNLRKGRFDLKSLKGKMKLMKMPMEPSNALLQVHARKYPPRYLHHTWTDYVYWSSDLKMDG